jgi:hypothetical protein
MRSLRFPPLLLLLLFVVAVLASAFSSPDAPPLFVGAGGGLLYLVNPSRGRRRKRKASGGPHRRRRHKKSHGVFAANPGHHKKRRRSHSHAVHFRHNPSSALMRDIAPIAIGAAGALATDVIAGEVASHLSSVMPASLATSPLLPWITTAVKAGLAVGAGLGVGKVLGRPFGQKFMVGALTVLAYAQARDLLLKLAPTLTLGAITESEFPQIGFAEAFTQFGESMPDYPAVTHLPLHGRYGDSGQDYNMGEVFSQR